MAQGKKRQKRGTRNRGSRMREVLELVLGQPRTAKECHTFQEYLAAPKLPTLSAEEIAAMSQAERDAMKRRQSKNF